MSRLQQSAPIICSVVFVALFLLDLVAVIANGYAAASMAAVAKDLEGSYKEVADLYGKETEASDVQRLAAYDAKQDTQGLLIRQLEVANEKLDGATAQFAKKAGEFKQMVCSSIDQMQGVSRPTKWFLPTHLISKPPTYARCSDPDRADSKPESNSKGAVDGVGPELVYEARQGASALLLLENYYILPVLFGALGAFLFCIRNSLVDLGAFYDPRNIAKFLIRVILGGIGGLIIGYFGISFAGNGGTSAVITASPLLFALAAGFSIETLIAVIENLASGIQRPATPPKG